MSINIEQFVREVDGDFETLFCSCGRIKDSKNISDDEKKQYYRSYKKQIIQLFINIYLKGSETGKTSTQKVDDFTDWLLSDKTQFESIRDKRRVEIMKLLANLIEFPQKRRETEQQLRKKMEI